MFFTADFSPPLGSFHSNKMDSHQMRQLYLKLQTLLQSHRNQTVCLLSHLSFSQPTQLSLFCPFLSLYGLIGPWLECVCVCVCFCDVSNGDRGWFEERVYVCVRMWFHTQQPYGLISHHIDQMACVSWRHCSPGVCVCVYECVLRCSH